MDALRRLYERATAGPTYEPDQGDLAEVHIAGLALPFRASIAVFAVTALILVDQLHWLLPASGDATTDALGLRLIPLARLALFLVAPLALILLAFRDRPARYGLRRGDWRWGAALLLAGLVVMTPIILGLASLASFRSFYGSAPVPFGAALLNNLVELIPAEFLFRGFLLFALWRRIGPLALVVVQVPFVLTHLGKPDVELWSTFIGGSIFAWLDWRTGSILWSALGHIYVLTLMTVAVGATLG
jgi:membrane protease YdiL (CAAX protease family)